MSARGQQSAGEGAGSNAVLAVVLLGMFTTAFPMTVLSASLDTIREELGTSLSTISWVQVAPPLASGVAVPIFGKLVDLWGARRVFLLGIGLTAVFSLATALAWNAASLIAIRTLGQLAGAASGPAGFAIVANTFHGAERARAIGRTGSISAIAPITGVAVGGPLVDWLGWEVLFLLQAVPATVGFVLARRWLPDAGVRKAVAFDVAGAVLLAVTIVAALFGLNRTRGWGIDHPVVLGCFLAAPVLAVAFVVVERRRANPLVPLDRIRHPEFRLALVTMGLLQLGFMGGSIAVPLLLNRRYGYALTVIAWIAACRPCGFAMGSWWSPVLRARAGVRRLHCIGAGLITVAALLLVLAASQRLLPVLLLGFVVGGFGNGMLYTSVITTVNELAARDEVGIANGLSGMVGAVGGAIGVTVLSAVIADATSTDAFVVGFAVLAAISIATIPLLVARTWRTGARPLVDGVRMPALPVVDPAAVG